MKLNEAELVGGPQDGAKVKAAGGIFPRAIYVGPKNLGDGFAAWSDEGSERFPAAYICMGNWNNRFTFNGWSQET